MVFGGAFSYDLQWSTNTAHSDLQEPLGLGPAIVTPTLRDRVALTES